MISHTCEVEGDALPAGGAYVSLLELQTKVQGKFHIDTFLSLERLILIANELISDSHTALGLVLDCGERYLASWEENFIKEFHQRQRTPRLSNIILSILRVRPVLERAGYTHEESYLPFLDQVLSRLT